jgi:hypothetical protein
MQQVLLVVLSGEELQQYAGILKQLIDDHHGRCLSESDRELLGNLIESIERSQVDKIALTVKRFYEGEEWKKNRK